MGLHRVARSQRVQLLLAALLTLGLCFWSDAVRAQFFSPGELAKGHAQLEGDEHCADCHSAGNRVSDDKCMLCHEDVGRSVRQKKGLHGRKFLGQPCGSCHVDHRGRDHSLVRWDPKTFEHAQTGWKLAGAHARVDCAKCHTGTNQRNHPTYIGLNSSCASCHEDKHQGRFGTSCQTCHDDVSWKNLDLDPFDHDQARFDLRGKHRQVPCAKCHGEPPKYQPLAFQACGDCHQDPHAGRLGSACEGCHGEDSWKKLSMKRVAHPGLSLQAGHASVACKACHDKGNLVSPSRGKLCASCHAPVHLAKFGDDCKDCHASIRWVGLPDALGRRVHAQTRYPLEGKHELTACDDCHSPKRPRAKRYRRLEFDSCMDCHRDVHKGQFQDRSGGECSACHDEDGFTTTSFGIEQHASARFALTGGHEATPCAECHTAERPRLDWQVQKQACSDCHENPHGTQFEKELQAGGCAACHSAVAWDIPNIAHDTWPLTGAHQKVRCDQCHTPSDADKRAGAGVSYRDAPRECEGCHADVHLGQFRLSEPRKECTDCHGTASFKLPGFDHLARAGYALEGKHTGVACRGCHLPAELATGESTLLWRLPYRDCKDCHGNPHAGAPR
jgi:hypothetical protein